MHGSEAEREGPELLHQRHKEHAGGQPVQDDRRNERRFGPVQQSFGRLLEGVICPVRLVKSCERIFQI